MEKWKWPPFGEKDFLVARISPLPLGSSQSGDIWMEPKWKRKREFIAALSLLLSLRSFSTEWLMSSLSASLLSPSFPRPPLIRGKAEEKEEEEGELASKGASVDGRKKKHR